MNVTIYGAQNIANITKLTMRPPNAGFMCTKDYNDHGDRDLIMNRAEDCTIIVTMRAHRQFCEVGWIQHQQL